MVGKTGRKCSSQGINVIAGGSKCMEDLYKASLPQKSSKFDRYIHYIVPAPHPRIQNMGLGLANGHKGTKQAWFLACRSCSTAICTRHRRFPVPCTSQSRRHL